jgi:hypothetical protein
MQSNHITEPVDPHAETEKSPPGAASETEPSRPGSRPDTTSESFDADEAEPAPHEHTPSRSDDN